MKYHKSWAYRPYRPPFIEVGDVYINRLVPYEDSVHIEWSATEDGKYEILYRIRGKEDWTKAGATDKTEFSILGLTAEAEYEIMVRCGDKTSRIRLFRTGKSVGTVINYLHPEDTAYAFSGSYLCSPSIIRTPQGHLLSSMDVFGGATPQNLSLIFRSDDNGKTWHYVCELFPCFWGKLFVHNSEVYMLSASTEYGDLQIGKSTDGGITWSEPVIILRGSNGKKGMAGPHRAPQSFVEFKGRLWTGVEWGAWGSSYHAPMLASVPVDADLLDPEAWLFTDPLMYSEEWEGVPKGECEGIIEGNAVVYNGELYDFMRYEMIKLERKSGLAIILKADPDNPEAQLTFDRVVEFPANASKFEIKYDEVSKRYYTIANLLPEKVSESMKHAEKYPRTHICLMYSENLNDWKVARSIIDYRDHDPNLFGFQYVSWFIEGDDILFQCRTAMNGAHTYHDSNYATFHTIKDFRK